MSYIGRSPAASALTSADITDGIIVEADLADDAVTADKLASNAVVNASVASGAAIDDEKIAPPYYSAVSALPAAGSHHGRVAHAHTEGMMYYAHNGSWIALAKDTAKQDVDAGLTSISALTTAADKMIYTTGADTYAVSDLTAAGRALLDDANASAQRTTLGLVIGTNVQAYNANLADLTADQTFTGQNRGGITALSNNTNTFDLTNSGIATNNFSVIFTTGSPALNFTIDANSVGQSGNIVFVNGDGSTNATAFSAGSTFKIASADLTTLATAGTYWMSYICISSTQVLVTISAKLY